MFSQAPEQIRADLHLLTVLRPILASAEPEEGCALLLGERLDFDWQLRLVWPCCNVWPQPQQRCQRFAIDPREQLQAQKWGRAQGLELLGSAHSHPTSGAVPSGTDRSLCGISTLMVILGAQNLGGELVAWWLPEAPAAPLSLPWRMVS
ncbi:M67 family metallopeptidase [Cyanobium sp. BA5m-21]|uniref:M67 family metallopeptidase n=1 Tax=Cyanobium sp. BA5m-21 TaxID=2823706 RepID=UPI0020CE3EA0|nr:M67 family metallopeptidase [Cyanobium sp. BA5m-21]MCP9907295.1 M67 family metallopeptidase [Cyanobium sp. BA5m-21]